MSLGTVAGQQRPDLLPVQIGHALALHRAANVAETPIVLAAAIVVSRGMPPEQVLAAPLLQLAPGGEPAGIGLHHRLLDPLQQILPLGPRIVVGSQPRAAVRHRGRVALI